ncbi:hypothetical protein [Paenibacillus rhizoplanae]|uniref:hypothetical protein n=1 Tax=Paenibacillus rhizoplanae TaxID=1917181 RepID=UPI003621A014
MFPNEKCIFARKSPIAQIVEPNSSGITTLRIKIVATLEGIIEVWNMAYHCPDPVCGKPKRYFRSVQADALCLKHTSYAYDVLALVGEMRFKQHMTVTEISEALKERGIPTSERHAMRLYEWYLTLLRASLTADVKEQLEDVVKEYNGLLLSMDGVQPEKGNETLYVVREGFSGRILAAKNLKSGSKTELMALLRPVKRPWISGHWSGQRWSTIHSTRDGRNLAEYAVPILPIPLSKRYCQACC